MQKIIRRISLLVIVSIMLVIPVSADSIDSRASAYFSSYDSAIDQITNTEFEVWYDVVAVDWMDELGVSSIEIQRSRNMSTWTTVATYYPEDYPQMIYENEFFVYDCVTHTGTPGYYYRAYVTFYAKKGTGTGYLFDYAEPIYISPNP